MNLDQHPCFSESACHTAARIHLPVAPRCNIQCNFCNRKHDCVNESRPGVTSQVLSPCQALAYLDRMMHHRRDIRVVGIAGPGDAFANCVETLRTLTLVRETYPDLMLCVASNGLNLAPYADDLARIGVSHVSITVNAIDPGIGAGIYRWVGRGSKVLRGTQGAAWLLARQLEAIAALKRHQILVKVNAIILPGINDHHLPDVARKMAALDVDLFNCMPFLPSPGCAFAHIPAPPETLTAAVRESAGRHLPQMRHCRRCRSDAVGRLHEQTDLFALSQLKSCSRQPVGDKPEKSACMAGCRAEAG